MIMNWFEKPVHTGIGINLYRYTSVRYQCEPSKRGYESIEDKMSELNIL